MREISLTSKYKVVKLFLTGSSYDEIAHQVGIAKGSVVNIIGEFREGHLPVPPDMAEYADALRQVAVDLRKNNTSIAQAQSCLKLDLKLREMGVSSDKAEHWLDICHNIASPTVSTDRFVTASLELSQAASESGLSYADVINDYNAKLSKSKELSKEIEREEQQLTETRARHQEEKEQATKELDAVTKAIATAQDMFRQQKKDLKARMDEYLAQHKLSWKKVNTVLALLDMELGRVGMAKADIEHLSRRIHNAGSLVNVINQLKREKDGLKSEVDRLAKEKQTISTSIDELKNIDDSLRTSIPRNKQVLDGLNTDLTFKRVEFEKLQQTVSQFTQNLYVSRLIIDFLFAPKSISDDDLDRLVSLMIGLRQKRLGIGPNQITDSNGKVVCECQVPRIYGDIGMDESDIDDVRAKFAHLLTPLVKDEFISKFDYDMRELEHKLDVLQAVVEERNRHLV
jgi:peptidoglycan hydrolase CwlO-like protein